MILAPHTYVYTCCPAVSGQNSGSWRAHAWKGLVFDVTVVLSVFFLIDALGSTGAIINTTLKPLPPLSSSRPDRCFNDHRHLFVRPFLFWNKSRATFYGITYFLGREAKEAWQTLFFVLILLKTGRELEMRTCWSWSFTYKYRVPFWLFLPFFSTEMKKLAQPTRSFFILKISWKCSPGWLQLVFHFGTENRADQLKNHPVHVIFCQEICIIKKTLQSLRS